jgi:hypothetical protein
MECAICFEKFFTPNSKEELVTWLEDKKVNRVECNMFNLLVTSKHNNNHTCCIENCHCVICGECWDKITKQKNDGPSQYFRCPYCRNIDWKDYMNIVFDELQIKVLGKDEYFKVMYELIMGSDNSFIGPDDY